MLKGMGRLNQMLNIKGAKSDAKYRGLNQMVKLGANSDSKREGD